MTHPDPWYARPDHIPVLGHRGISAHYPENTLISFEAALKLGVDLIEFDINVTKDGQLVVIHDNDIARTSDHAGLTRDYTLAELKSFDFGYPAKFGAQFAGAPIPTFREVLELVQRMSDTVLLNVEIKDMHHQTVDDTIALLHEFGLEERSVIACFDAEILRYTKAAHPHMRCQGFPGRYMRNFTEDTYGCMFGMGIPIGGKDRTAEGVREDVAFAKENGILAWLYVCDTTETVRDCVAYGADNVTGNDPAVALETLRSMGLHA